MRIAYERTGEGQPLVLVNGLGQPSQRWRRVVPHLAKSHEVITLDNRETGRTGSYPDGFVLADLAADVLETVSVIGHDTFFIAGVSMGGMIAQEVISLAPKRVLGAVLISTHPGASLAIEPDPAVFSKIFAPVPEDDEGRRAAFRRVWEVLSAPGFAQAHRSVIEEEMQLSIDVPTPVEGLMRQMRAIALFDAGAAAGEAASGAGIPVKIVHGDADPLVPYQNGQQLAELFGCELATFENVGHTPDIETPEKLAAAIAMHSSDA